MLITHLLLALEVWDGKPTYMKSWAGKLVLWLDLTLDLSFKVKRAEPNLKVLITRLLLGLEVWNGRTNLLEIMGWKSFGVVRFDFRLLLQVQTRIAKLKSAYNSLIMGPRGLQCETN